MKKSFMTRALATGLSLAMAFSLTAATNVTTAAAAAKPAMKSSKMTVKVGQSKNYKATAATQKAYKITKVKLSAAGKTKADVTINSSKKSIKVTGKEATKGSNVVIIFKNNKTKKLTKVTTKVVVKAVEEKLAMTASATGVKKITVNFNKAVDTKTVLNLSKGSVKPSVSETTWNAEGTEAVIKLAGKLTEGIYTVSATVDSQDITADVTVAKNETLTSFKIVGNTLKAVSATNTTKGYIEYQGLNQYDEPMSAPNAVVTIAPGQSVGVSPSGNTPTASKNGRAYVDDIPETYAIAGSEFTVTIVDNSGVNYTGKVVYGAAATPMSVEAVGLYNVNKGKIQDMTAGDKVADYEALYTVKDQYGDPYEVTASDVATVVSAIALGGTTNVKVNDTALATTYSRTIDDVKYFAIPLVNAGTSTTAVAGDFSINLVNKTRGTMGNPSYTILENVIIQSISISSDGVYAGQNNTMTYDVVDTKGNTVTSYATLKNIDFTAGSDGGKLNWEKNADGTAKLVYVAANLSSPVLKSGVESFTATANEMTSKNYLVKTFTLTRQAMRKAAAVVGISSKVATSTAASEGTITLKFEDLLIEDQYGNTFTSDELKAGQLVSKEAIFVTGAAVSATNTTTGAVDAWVTSGGAIDAVSGVAFDQGKVIFTAPATTVALDVKYNLNVNGIANEGYTLTLSKVSNAALKNVTDLEIASVNDGYAVRSTDGGLSVSLVNSAASAKDSAKTIPVVVTGKVGGKKVIITSAEADASIDAPALGEHTNTTNLKNEKGSVKVIVNTADGPVTLTKEIEVSNETTGSAFTIKKNDSYVSTTDRKSVVDGSAGTENRISNLTGTAYDAVDKYGNKCSADADSTVYKVAVKKVVNSTDIDITKTVEASRDSYYTIDHDGMHSATFVTNGSQRGNIYTVHVVATAANGVVVEYDFTYQVA